ncbi:MAG: hypothetical protein K2Q18_19635 [Bdellovibrionales bacterium]|nr:hypothetical protein [Bdellovibrionales bacterium]
MERSWLIRTTQNQILGPVAKQKLLEFIQKGALGMMDEVSSGNGYWFTLKEKELVDKYLFGDLPQGYNPISEAQSVISRRENVDKTSSINASPANIKQVSKSLPDESVASPTKGDLEFPDITLIGQKIKLDPQPQLPPLDDTKLPAADDLEFPDVSKISSDVKKSFQEYVDLAPVSEIKLDLQIDTPSKSVEKKTIVTEVKDDPSALLPSEDDLAFPEVDDFKVDYQTSPKIEKGKVDLSHQHTRTVALDINQKDDVLPTAKEVSDFFAKEAGLMDADLPPITLKTTAHTLKKNSEEKKLLHERKKLAANKTGAALRDPTREKIYKDTPAPEPLKKRNDNYIFFILVILILIIVAVFFYFKEILNKPLPV